MWYENKRCKPVRFQSGSGPSCEIRQINPSQTLMKNLQYVLICTLAHLSMQHKQWLKLLTQRVIQIDTTVLAAGG